MPPESRGHNMGTRKVMEVVREGKHLGWSFHCPACGFLHWVDERWTFNGSVDAPSFQPSVKVTKTPFESPEQTCHFYVTNGVIIYQTDCTHDFRGKQLVLPEVDREID